uniref:Uncharacterized protein n=1 Tax=Vannella robusta TaxID=1487602 RepID=A0A7S4MN09_9EUKA
MHSSKGFTVEKLEELLCLFGEDFKVKLKSLDIVSSRPDLLTVLTKYLDPSQSEELFEVRTPEVIEIANTAGFNLAVCRNDSLLDCFISRNFCNPALVATLIQSYSGILPMKKTFEDFLVSVLADGRTGGERTSGFSTCVGTPFEQTTVGT